MNYRHSFHAGSFSDVFKHLVLMTLLKSFCKKEKPFCVFETHAGQGMYDLQSVSAQKTKEYLQGIKKIYMAKSSPKIISEYLEFIRGLNQNEKNKFSARFYPGSPMIINHLLREQDQGIFVELEPQCFEILKRTFNHDKRMYIHHRDGFLALNALLPPPHRRGFVFMDSAFENNNEFDVIIKSVENGLKKWQTACFAVWYPIKNKFETDRFINRCKVRFDHNLLNVEFSIYPADNTVGINGCGMLLINPPWQIDEEIKEFLPWLWRELSEEKQGGYNITWVKQNED